MALMGRLIFRPNSFDAPCPESPEDRTLRILVIRLLPATYLPAET